MKREIALIGMVLLLSGCSHLQSNAKSRAAQRAAAAAELTQVRAQLAADSARLREAQEAIAREMELRAPPVPPAEVSDVELPQIPSTGPLSGKKFGMSMQDARIGQLLWVVAQEFNMGLSIDPAVLESTKTVNLFLKDVTGRQALVHILKTFDVYGSVGPDNVLRVSTMEERIFPVDALAIRGALGVNVGGDALGAGTAEGSSGLRDSVILSGGLGDDKSDAWASLGKTLDILLSEEEGGKSGAESTTKSAEAARYSMDRSSGSLYVRARPSKIQTVSKMLERGRTYRGRQVQIDAQLLDVTLNNDSQLGINWTSLGNRVMATVGASPATIGQALGTIAAPANLLSRSVTIPSQLMGTTGGSGGGITVSNRVFSATINALKSYGRVKVLSNPSLRVSNGVPAFLSVGTNFRYVKEITKVAGMSLGGMSAGGVVPMTSEVKTDNVFSGVVLGLGAVVKDSGDIELFVRPSQTVVQRESLALLEVGDGNRLTLPVVATKSMTTMLNMRDGDVVLLGGLIAQESSNGGQGLPGLSDAPGLGALFRSTSEAGETRELVMIIRARIVQ
ncbi:pilus (MSHA type) biogenesis protein MshL [Hydrogenophaga sp.]